MKQSDPAIALPDDAFIGTPNFNPRAINYYQRGKLDPQKEIFPIGNFGNPHIASEHLQFFQQQIKDIMFYNTFQAFSDLTKQMTVPEVMERVSEKMTLLGPAIGRFMNDVLQPLIEKVVHIEFEAGRLPPLPDAMRADPEFEVKFVGRLVQSQRQSEINNIMSALSIAGQVAAYKPEVLDKINGDDTIDEIFDITGVTTRMLNSDEEVRQMRQRRAEAQAEQQQIAAAQAGAQTYKDMAQGEKNVKESRFEG